MAMIANIVCKTAGVAGMSAVLYDAYASAKHHSAAGASNISADVYQSAVAAQRSNASESHITGKMQKKIADMRMQNPIIPMVGKTKGFIEGFIGSLGDNIVPISFSALALAAKGFMQKAGAWGLAAYAAYQVAKEGFGLGKSSPVDE